MSVEYRAVDGVAIITLRRPEALNALDDRAVTELAAAWQRLEESPERCAILTGEGRGFCVGADVSDIPQDFPSCVPGLVRPLSKPVIAAVNGFAIGGGYILVQQSDLAIASTQARFRYPEARLGFTGGLVAGSAVRTPRKIAMELMLLGDWMGAERAAHFGLVNKVVPADDLLDEALVWGRRIAANAPLVVSVMRDLVDQTVPRSPIENMAATRGALARIDLSEDKQEGVSALREKRTPEFGGR